MIIPTPTMVGVATHFGALGRLSATQAAALEAPAALCTHPTHPPCSPHLHSCTSHLTPDRHADCPLRLLACPATPHTARPTNPVSRSDFVAARMALSRMCPRPAPSHPPSPAAFARALCELRAVCQPTHTAASPMPCACPVAGRTGALRLTVPPYPASCPRTAVRGAIHRALWSAPRDDPALPAAAAAATPPHTLPAAP
eukprot:COSAG01_NODE_18198_length_1094_cov_0.873367_1_plen_198_part_10